MTATTTVLYGFVASPYVRAARMALEEKEVTYAIQSVDMAAPDYVQFHPYRRMPVLDMDGVRLFETAAILRFVDEARPGPSLQPGDPAGRARMTQWISVLNSYVGQGLVREVLYEILARPFMGQTTDWPRVEAAIPGVSANLAILERGLGSNPYFAGDSFSLADILYYPMLNYASGIDKLADAFAAAPNLRAWLARVAERPSVAKTQPDFSRPAA